MGSGWLTSLSFCERRLRPSMAGLARARPHERLQPTRVSLARLKLALYARCTAHAARFQPRVGGRDMTLQRMDNVLIVVDDLQAAKAFFVELGMELEGEMAVEGRWVDRVVGLDDVRQNVAMLPTP